MRDLADLAIDCARSAGASYADVRITEVRNQRISTKNGKVGSVEDAESYGFGVRVIADGAWGFASSDILDRENVQRVAREAVSIARASASLKERDVALAPEEKHVDTWATPIEEDPFAVSLETKLGLLFEIDRICRKVKGVAVVEGHMGFVRKKQLFVNTEGSVINQTIVMSGVGYAATAIESGEIQKRSYPNSHGGQWETRGYEITRSWPLVENAERVAEEAVALLKADQCPSGEKDLILDGSQLGLQIHESCGHPAELDRVLGMEANYAGMSFLTTDKLGKLRYGSEVVNLVSDATLEHGHGCGTFGYDDEGVPAQRFDLVRNGLFVGYLTSRETAALVGLERSNGTMRASGWNRIPLIRMTNTSLEPGDWELDDLIADTRDGIYMETNRSWSIDDRRYNFQFGTEIAWEIRNGKKVRMLRNPTYSGITTEFWNACDAICSRKHWVLWGVPNCGKGQPSQVMATGHGASPARFRGIKIGMG